MTAPTNTPGASPRPLDDARDQIADADPAALSGRALRRQEAARVGAIHAALLQTPGEADG